MQNMQKLAMEIWDAVFLHMYQPNIVFPYSQLVLVKLPHRLSCLLVVKKMYIRPQRMYYKLLITSVSNLLCVKSAVQFLETPHHDEKEVIWHTGVNISQIFLIYLT